MDDPAFIKVLLNVDGNKFKIMIRTSNYCRNVPFGDFRNFLKEKHLHLFTAPFQRYNWKIFDNDFGEYVALNDNAAVHDLSKLKAVSHEEMSSEPMGGYNAGGIMNPSVDRNVDRRYPSTYETSIDRQSADYPLVLPVDRNRSQIEYGHGMSVPNIPTGLYGGSSSSAPVRSSLPSSFTALDRPSTRDLDPVGARFGLYDSPSYSTTFQSSYHTSSSYPGSGSLYSDRTPQKHSGPLPTRDTGILKRNHPSDFSDRNASPRKLPRWFASPKGHTPKNTPNKGSPRTSDSRPPFKKSPQDRPRIIWPERKIPAVTKADLVIENEDDKRNLMEAVYKYNEELSSLGKFEDVWTTEQIWRYVAKENISTAKEYTIQDCRRHFRALMNQYIKVLENYQNLCVEDADDVWKFFSFFHKKLDLSNFEKGLSKKKAEFDAHKKDPRKSKLQSNVEPKSSGKPQNKSPVKAQQKSPAREPQKSSVKVQEVSLVNEEEKTVAGEQNKSPGKVQKKSPEKERKNSPLEAPEVVDIECEPKEGASVNENNKGKKEPEENSENTDSRVEDEKENEDANIQCEDSAECQEETDANANGEEYGEDEAYDENAEGDEAYDENAEDEVVEDFGSNENNEGETKKEDEGDAGSDSNDLQVVDEVAGEA